MNIMSQYSLMAVFGMDMKIVSFLDFRQPMWLIGRTKFMRILNETKEKYQN